MKLIKYQAPKWFLNNELVKKYLDFEKIPKLRLELLDSGPEGTPIQKLPFEVSNYQLYIKRDDQTHRELQLQGNKLRKLEFLFADALDKNAKHILTAGGLQSNHCRTVAGVARLLNLKSHLFLRSDSNDPKNLNPNGNLLLNFLLDSNIYLIEKRAQYLTQIEFKLKILAEKLQEKYKENSYIIPIGGSNTIGLFGYLEQFNEIISKNFLIDDLVVTTGSGGTMSALAIANYLTGNKFRLHAFCVCDNAKYFYEHLKIEFENLFGQNTGVDTKSLVNIIQCSRGLGYAKSTEKELEFIRTFLGKTGILLDPVYTGKTMYTLVNLLNGFKPSLEYESDENARNFRKNLKGNRILFIHTGGQLGNFDVFKYQGLKNLVEPNSNVFNCFGDNIYSINF